MSATELTKAEKIHNILTDLYKADKPGSSPIIEYTDSYDLNLFNKLKKLPHSVNTKTFHFKKMEEIKNNLIFKFNFSVSIPKGQAKGTVDCSDVTGIFKVTFTDNTFLYYAKWVSGAGRNRTQEGLLITEEKVWHNFLKLIKKETKTSNKPKPGVYRINYDTRTQTLSYDKVKSLIETPIVHPAIDELSKDIDFFYNNVHVFTRYNQPGTRKIMLIGEPGTGKSSICMKQAKKFEKEKCVAFATNIEAVAAHLSKCAKSGMSTFVILEDAESSLERPNSSVLNFLDGIDQPVNKAGAYLIMTTNFPDKLEPRILKRPGRVDKIIQFDALRGSYALKCAEIYFEGILFFKDKKKSAKEQEEEIKIKKSLTGVVDKMTGAQIKELAQSSISFAVSNNKEVNIETITEVKDRMHSSIKDANKLAMENSLIGGNKKVGFGNQSDESDERWMTADENEPLSM
jgi:hypothetical protein